MTLLSCPCTSLLIPRAALAPEPLQYLQVTMPSCTSACAIIPRAALAPEPLHDLQIAGFIGIEKEVAIQLQQLSVFSHCKVSSWPPRTESIEGENEVRSQNREKETVEKKTHLHPK